MKHWLFKIKEYKNQSCNFRERGRAEVAIVNRRDQEVIVNRRAKH